MVDGGLHRTVGILSDPARIFGTYLCVYSLVEARTQMGCEMARRNHQNRVAGGRTEDDYRRHAIEDFGTLPGATPC